MVYRPWFSLSQHIGSFCGSIFLHLWLYFLHINRKCSQFHSPREGISLSFKYLTWTPRLGHTLLPTSSCLIVTGIFLWSNQRSNHRCPNGISGFSCSGESSDGRLWRKRVEYISDSWIWYHYVDDTFTVLHSHSIDTFTKHINSIDSNLQFTIEP